MAPTTLISNKNTTFSPNGVADSEADYAHLGLKPGSHPEEWEDGQRIPEYNGVHNFEWWYFDAKMEDGSTLVVTFLPKPTTNIAKLRPAIHVELERPDGTVFDKMIHIDPKDFSATKDTCNIRFGDNYFVGNLHDYKMHVKDERISVDLDIHNEVEPWRQDTGHIFYSEDRSQYMAWVVPVPKGKVEATITLDGNTSHLTGSCYHDPNWGTISILKNVNHWYWARAELGPYAVSVCDYVSEKEFDYNEAFLFYLSKEGKTTPVDKNKVEAYRSVPKIQTAHGMNKPMSDALKFVYGTSDDNVQYILTSKKDHNVSEMDLIEKSIQNKFLRWAIETATGVLSLLPHGWRGHLGSFPQG